MLANTESLQNQKKFDVNVKKESLEIQSLPRLRVVASAEGFLGGIRGVVFFFAPGSGWRCCQVAKYKSLVLTGLG